MRVQLARIEGKMDLSNLRHDQTEARLLDHGTRLVNIEAREHRREGERKGVANSGRVLWAFIGFVPPAVVAIAKLLGL